MPPSRDARLVFVGTFVCRGNRGRRPAAGQARRAGAPAEIFEPWVPAIKGVDFDQSPEVIYWLHESRRDLALQSPKNNQKTRGTSRGAHRCGPI